MEFGMGRFDRSFATAGYVGHGYDAVLSVRLLEASDFSYVKKEDGSPLDRVPDGTGVNRRHFAVSDYNENMRVSYVEAFSFEIRDLSFSILKMVDGKGVVIAFRGTDNAPNWARDANFALLHTSKVMNGIHHTRVHKGFKWAVNEIWTELMKQLAIIQTEYADKELEIHWTGHSLGAAMATVALARCFSAGEATAAPRRVAELIVSTHAEWNPEMSALCRFVTAHTRSLYTYASPYCGDEAFCQFLTERCAGRISIQRLHAEGDPITTIKGDVGYKHVGNDILIPTPYPHRTMHYKAFTDSFLMPADRAHLYPTPVVSTEAETKASHDSPEAALYRAALLAHPDWQRRPVPPEAIVKEYQEELALSAPVEGGVSATSGVFVSQAVTVPVPTTSTSVATTSAVESNTQ